ncbi:CDP-alcohol phosphatidyltransferase family protein [Halobacterium yunchengense]|uniref:CDP-alcohol phosphatidyltransferase family protein n=1 Tax=Halobacterium yunchengense TaxID=3108497 RepID=UPI00300ADA00
MTLDRFRPLATRLLRPWVRGAVAVGATPDVISVAAFLLAVGAAGAFYVATPLAYAVGALLVAANGWLDLLDGAVARELGTDSMAGDLLDHVLDRYADVFVVAGLAAGVGRYDLGLAAVTGVLLTSYLGTQAQAVGLDRVYGGLLGRADRLALVGVTGGVAALRPGLGAAGLSVVGWLLVLFAVVGHLTAVQRFVSAWRQLA